MFSFRNRSTKDCLTNKSKSKIKMKRLFKKQNNLEPQTHTLNIPTVSERSEKFSCPLPETKGCDRHKIDDEEGRWEFCNTCKREWAR